MILLRINITKKEKLYELNLQWRKDNILKGAKV